ncbi:Enamine/imine deaminase [Marinomonas gallaica]|uniref:Enamine/imine deaminase n=1 Tax=Marinomonas gallaica TaxID=1806667 RepID=A0A1C3JQ61_9GAMM|nr:MULTISPECIES: RidA family protein [Marinomonas]MCO4785682.1 RidA family protein [Marinomonas atlantica]SBT17334.1 Enamine/imine deaminase [Marinomonas gallaica]SBT22222.1 Enamine/imine deaminase [Marinomonas gallaica]
MAKQVIFSENAPAAIGPYSQAVRAGNTVYLSGQIPLVPETMEVISDDVAEQTTQVFKNLQAVCEAAGGSLKDIVKLNIYMTDLGNFALVNEVMTKFFVEPYPARAALGVRALPKGVAVEIEGVLVLED